MENREVGRPSRVWIVWSLLCGCGAALAQPFPDPTANLPRNSHFLQGRYSAPAAQSAAALMTIADVFRFTGHSGDGRLLLNVVERRELKRLLGEPYQPQGTVETAIRAERAEPEPIEALRTRVVRGVTASRTASKGDELGRFDRDAAAPYVGNSIWAARGERDILAYLRLSARNQLTEEIAEFQIILEKKDAPDPYYLALTCRPEDRGAIPPSGSKPVICRSRDMLPLAGTALEQLRANRIAGPFVASAIETPNRALLVARQLVRFNNQVTPFGDEARRQIAAAAANCNYVNNCEQVQRVQTLKEEVQARQERPRNTYLGLLAGAVVLLFLAVPRITDRRAPASPNVLMSLLVGAIVLTTLFELGAALVLFRPRAGYEALAAGVVGYYALIPHAILVLALGAAFGGNPEYVSRFRLYVLGHAIVVPAAAWIALSRA